MQEFLKVRELLAIRDHCFVRNAVAYQAVLVTHGLRDRRSEPAPAEKARESGACRS